jgi:hypothetical protein
MIEIPTSGMTPSDGVTLRLLLCKDMRKLDVALANIERENIGDVQYLAHVPDLGIRLGAKDSAAEKPTGAKCRLCRQPICVWENATQRRVHCGCTIWIFGLDVDGAEEIDTQLWGHIVRSARRGIQQWIQRS